MEQGVVAQQAHAGQVEGDLDKEGARQEEAEVMPEGRRDRDQGVAQRVHEDDAAVAHALRAGRADVVRAQALEQAVAREEGEGREGADRHAAQRQQCVVEARAPGQAVPGEALGREPMQLVAEVFQQHDRQHVARDRIEDEERERRAPVEGAITLERFGHAEGNRDGVGEHERPASEPDRQREAGLDLRPDGFVALGRFAEVELEETGERRAVEHEARGLGGVVGQRGGFGAPVRDDLAGVIGDREPIVREGDFQFTGDGG